jgi:hypothetical protein
MSKTYKNKRKSFDDDYEYGESSFRKKNKPLDKWKIERRKQTRKDNMIDDKNYYGSSYDENYI